MPPRKRSSASPKRSPKLKQSPKPKRASKAKAPRRSARLAGGVLGAEIGGASVPLASQFSWPSLADYMPTDGWAAVGRWGGAARAALGELGSAMGTVYSTTVAKLADSSVISAAQAALNSGAQYVGMDVAKGATVLPNIAVILALAAVAAGATYGAYRGSKWVWKRFAGKSFTEADFIRLKEAIENDHVKGLAMFNDLLKQPNGICVLLTVAKPDVVINLIAAAGLMTEAEVTRRIKACAESVSPEPSSAAGKAVSPFNRYRAAMADLPTAALDAAAAPSRPVVRADEAARPVVRMAPRIDDERAAQLAQLAAAVKAQAKAAVRTPKRYDARIYDTEALRKAIDIEAAKDAARKARESDARAAHDAALAAEQMKERMEAARKARESDARAAHDAALAAERMKERMEAARKARESDARAKQIADDTARLMAQAQAIVAQNAQAKAARDKAIAAKRMEAAHKARESDARAQAAKRAADEVARMNAIVAQERAAIAARTAAYVAAMKIEGEKQKAAKAAKKAAKMAPPKRVAAKSRSPARRRR